MRHLARGERPHLYGRDDQDRDDDAVQRSGSFGARRRRHDVDRAGPGRAGLLSDAHPCPPDFPAKPAVDIAGCSAWPCEDAPSPGTPGSENSLADVAQYYYKNDLRPLMADNVPRKGLGVEDDNAKHQHMTTFALALGVSGTLNFRADYRNPVDRGRRLRRDPRRDQGLAGVARSAADVREPGRLQQSEVDRRLLAHGGQRPRQVLQRQRRHLGGARAARRAGVDRQPAGLGIGRRNLDAAAERDRQLHLLDQVPVVDLARRRRGAADRPDLGRRRAEGLVGERSARPAHVRRLRQPQDLRHARRQSARRIHLADRHLSGRRADRNAGD